MGLDHVIRYISPSCFEILGWYPAEMVAKDLRQFVSPDDVPAMENLVVSRPPDGVAYTHARLRLLKKSQNLIWISINARCVRDSVTGESREYVLCMRDISGRTALEEQLSALAMTDALTGLWNRRAFEQALQREWKRTARKESDLSLLLLDLDHFKPLNDRYGHPLGDECLAAVAATINATVRAADVVCRWGGDEVAIILPATDAAGALHVAEKIRSAIEALRLNAKGNSGEWVSVTASIGGATAQVATSGEICTPQEQFLAADRALYRAKQEGHNRVVMASDIPSEEVETPESIAAIGEKRLKNVPCGLRSEDGLAWKGQPGGVDGL